MLKFMNKNKGAISIFLVIVLLPILSVASIFVDMSRINLGNAMAKSAGDLTLNTALTNYDAEMKNLYGLFATSQDMEELMANLEDYYRDSIMAAGVDSETTDDVVDNIMNHLKTTTGTSDVMNIELESFEVSSPDGGNLGNPAILKSQVVEFMKYRGPLALGTGLLDAFGMMKNLKKQTKLVEDKNKFYEEHQSMLKTIEEAWIQIETYQYSHMQSDLTNATRFPTGSYISDNTKAAYQHAAKGIEDYAADWKDASIVSDWVKYLYNTGDFKPLTDSTGNLNYKIELYYECSDSECGYINPENKTECGACQKKINKNKHEYKHWKMKCGGSLEDIVPAYTEDDPAIPDDVLTALNTMLVAYDQVKKYTTGANKKAYDLAINKYNQLSTPEAKIHAVCQFNQEISKSNNYFKVVKVFLQSMVDLASALRTCDPDELALYKVNPVDDKHSQYVKVETSNSGTPISGFVGSNLNGHYNLDNGGILFNYGQVVSRISGLYWDQYNTVENARSNVATKIEAIRKQANDFYTFIDTKIGNLSTAISKLTTVKNMLSGAEGTTYKTKLDSWESSAGTLSDDTMGKNDKAEIEKLKELITVDRVDSLITRLKGAKTTLEGIRDQIAKYKFANNAVKDIKKRSDYSGNGTYIAGLKPMLSSYDSAIKEVDPVAGETYDVVIGQILGSVEKGSINLSWGDGVNSPDLTKDQRDLYTWLYNNYYDKNRNYAPTTETKTDTENGGKDLDSLKGDLEKEAPSTDKEPEGATTKVDREVTKYYKCTKCDLMVEKGVSKCSCGEKISQTDENLAAIMPSQKWEGTVEDIKSGAVKTDSDDLLKSTNEDGGFLEQIVELATNVGTEVRDNLYVAEYMMSMFSYDTIEREAYVKKEGKSSGFKAFWKEPGEGGTEYTENNSDYIPLVESLTKNSINPNMNYLYQEEVEYILYGENGKAKVYGTIFVLRFALNTVYAFTDAEINNITLSAATTLFGTPPLTPLIPIAKAAMTIALAVAESAWDLVQLKSGESIPLMKNRDTWVMSPSGLVSEVKDKAQEEVKAFAENAIDEVTKKGYEILSDAISMTSDELQAFVKESEDNLSSLAKATTTSVTDNIKNAANEAVQKVVGFINEENLSAMMDNNNKMTDDNNNFIGYNATPEKLQNVMNRLQSWLNDSKSADDELVYEAKKIAYDYLTENGGEKITNIFSSLNEQAQGGTITNPIDSVLDNLKGEIDDKIDVAISAAGNKLNEKIGDLENQLKDELKAAADKGAEKLKETLNNKISGAFDKIPTKENGNKQAAATPTVMNTLLSWSYSDYLHIFVVVGLFANEELMLLRMADVIEMNMQHKNNEYAVVTKTETVETSRFFGLIKKTEEKEVASTNDKAFSLSKSYTYLNIKATLSVKPLLMTMPFMAATVEKEIQGTKWYKIEYSGTMGY